MSIAKLDKRLWMTVGDVLILDLAYLSEFFKLNLYKIDAKVRFSALNSFVKFGSVCAYLHSAFYIII